MALALQAFLAQSWGGGGGWETLPSASLPSHQGGNRLPRQPSLAPTDPTQPWTALTILQAPFPCHRTLELDRHDPWPEGRQAGARAWLCLCPFSAW